MAVVPAPLEVAQEERAVVVAGAQRAADQVFPVVRATPVATVDVAFRAYAPLPVRSVVCSAVCAPMERAGRAVARG